MLMYDKSKQFDVVDWIVQNIICFPAAAAVSACHVQHVGGRRAHVNTQQQQ